MRRTKNQATKAFTMVEMLVVIGVVGVVVLLLLPALVPATGHIRPNCASNLKQVGLAFRLWSGDNSDRYPQSYAGNTAYPIINSPAPLATPPVQGPVWSAAGGGSANMFTVFMVMSNELYNPKIVVCPGDKQRKPATNFTSDFNGSHISYFVGLDASEQNPQRFLAGDSNITNGLKPNAGLMELTTNQIVSWTAKRHVKQGNIAMADGSVQQFTTAMLQQALQKTGLATNRLLMPPSP